MSWDALIGHGRKVIAEDEARRNSSLAANAWAAFRAAARNRLGDAGIDLGLPDEPPPQFRDYQRVFEWAIRVPGMHDRVAIRFKMIRVRTPIADAWEVAKYTDEVGRQCLFAVPRLAVHLAGDQQVIEQRDATEWYYADSLDVAAALADRACLELVSALDQYKERSP